MHASESNKTQTSYSKLKCEEYDKQLLQTDPRAKRILAHENRLIVKDEILMSKYNGQILHHQILQITPQSNTRTNVKTDWKNKNDLRMQIKILLSRPCKKNQTVGTEVRGLHQK